MRGLLGYRFGCERDADRRLRKTLALPVLAFAILAAGAASEASEQSELLYSRGLVALHEEDYAEALSFFDRAVHADPRDANALFYRGLTRGRLKDYDHAITDLLAAVELDPQLHEATLELGVAYVQSARYREAISWLQRAQEVEAFAGQASLFLGIAQLRLGDTAAARQNFLRAAEHDPKLRVPATYYLGVIAYQEKRYADARVLFEEVAGEQPASDIGTEAAAFLTAIGRRARPYLVYGRLGLDYDSNVALAPGDQTVDIALGISDQADGRVTIAAGGLYRLIDEPEAAISVGYDFFQGLQFKLTDFNLMDNRVHLEGVRRWDLVEIAGLASYDYYIRDGDSFLSQVNAAAFVTLKETERAASTLVYRFRFNDYLEQPFGDLLSGFYNAMGLRQFFYLGAPTRYVLIGYQYEIQDTSHAAGDAYAYQGSIVEGGFGWLFPWSIDLQALLAYHHDDYATASDGRVDDEYVGVLSITKPVLDYLDVGASFYADVDDSTKVEFSYNRFVGTIFAEVRY